MLYILCFFAGGYFINAAHVCVSVMIADRASEDNPEWIESLLSGIVAGVLWPITPLCFQGE